MQDLRSACNGVERGNLNNDENYDLMISNMISIPFERSRSESKNQIPFGFRRIRSRL